jgi:RNA polymerase sigma-70 factor (ECF subfamily)
MEIHRSRAPLSLVVGGKRHREVSDRDLARGLAAKEDWAVAETWRRFAPMVLMTAERALGSKTEAEDVAQEVFHRVFQKARTLRDPNQLRSFIYSFAIRVLKSELRRRKRRRWLGLQRGEADALDAGAADVESRDLLRRFNRLLDRLAARDRLVFVLRRMEAMTIDETAATMGLSISTVKRSLAHASLRLTHWIDMDPELSRILEENRWGI